MNLNILNSDDFIVFWTRDYAVVNNLSITAASKKLSRMQAKGLLVKVTRGIWANTNHPYFSPMIAVPYLLHNEHGCVSFLTAMQRHGIISQIPHTIQIATTGRPRKLQTPIANYEYIQLAPNMFLDGIIQQGHPITYPMASPEKSLLDTLYISTRKGKRFASLPELDLSNFNEKKFTNLLNKCVNDKRIKSAIMTRYPNVLENKSL